MRFDDVQPNTEYATCDKLLARTAEEVVPYYETKRHSNKFEPTKPGEGDPWSKCTTAGGRLVRYVRLEVFSHDEHGTPVASHGFVYRKASDIGGLWDDYKLLHADDVEWYGLRTTMSIEAKERGEELRRMVTSRGFQTYVEVVPQVLVEYTRHGSTHSEWWAINGWSRGANERIRILDRRFHIQLRVPNEDSERLLGMISRQRKVAQLKVVGEES